VGGAYGFDVRLAGKTPSVIRGVRVEGADGAEEECKFIRCAGVVWEGVRFKWRNARGKTMERVELRQEEKGFGEEKGRCIGVIRGGLVEGADGAEEEREQIRCASVVWEEVRF